MFWMWTVVLVGCGGDPSPARTTAEPLAAQGARATGAMRTDGAVLDVTITGFRNDAGHARVALFASEEGFPSQGERAVRGEALAIRGGEVKVSFADLAAGSYAIVVLHDEDDDSKMDTNMLGMPQEGYGVSRNAQKRFGAPAFEDAKITVGAGQTVPVRIQVAYP